MKRLRAALIVVAAVSFAVAAYYPIQYRIARQRNEAQLGSLSAMHKSAQETPAEGEEPAPTSQPEPTSEPAPTSAPAPISEPEPTSGPTPSPDRRLRHDATPYPDKEKVQLDESRILPELAGIYQLNHDLVGWLTIPDTNVDYPVVQSEDGSFYLLHDFYGRENGNGQIILQEGCDPYTPSYNLVISGHHMRSGDIFGRLMEYQREEYWERHKLVEFDSLMDRRQYVVFAAFFSADYDVDEEGFRYSVDIEYRKDAELWLEQIRANQLFDTGVDAEFGDEFLTLTTCTQTRQNGRFVVVCRRIRKGETFA